MKPLAILTNEYLALLDMADTGDEADQQAFIDTLEGLQGDLETKVLGTGTVCLNLLAQVEAIKSEEKRLSHRRSVIENNVKRLKDSMEKALRAAKLKKINGKYVTVSLQFGPPSVVIDEKVTPEMLPKEYQRIPPAEANKQAIKDALVAGKKLEFASLQKTESIRIR